jgi:hypothetical protein
MRPLALGRTPVATVRESDALVDAIAAVTGLRRGAVRNRADGAHGQRHVRTVFGDRWPTRLDELGAEPGGDLAKDSKLVSELARLLGREPADVAAGLRAKPKTLAKDSLRALWTVGEDHSGAALLNLTVQQARGRGEARALAKSIGVDPARFSRRIRSAHGAMLVRNAIVDLLPQEVGPMAAGMRFGRYQLDGRTWEGGYGIVREAWDCGTTPKHRVVLKWPKGDTKSIETLEGEYERARDLRHPGLVGYFAIQRESGGSPVLVIGHGGTSLVERLEKTRFDVPDSIALCRKLASALDYLGEKNLAHRDLHPGNVLVDAEGEPRITDFGIARRLVGGPGKTGVTSQVFGYFAGFAAPEVERGRSASRSSDQFSLALVFLACVCGGGEEALDCEERGKFPLTGRQIDAFRRARSTSPGARFPSCAAFVDALARPGLFARLLGGA